MSTFMLVVLGFIAFVILVCLLIVFWIIATYNGFVESRTLVEEAWSGIDVQLKRRANLIPNLVATVKGYAEHESNTFAEVTEARASIGGKNLAERAETEGRLQKSLMSLFAVAEAYPQLQADENFRSLQNEISGLEDVIQKARRYYNGTVRDFNTKLQVFPANLVGSFFKFAQAEFYEVENQEDTVVPRVDFSDQ